MSFEKVFNYDVKSNYSYDSTAIDVVEEVPADVISFNNFASKDLGGGGGVLTGTLSGGANVNRGWFHAETADAMISYAASGNTFSNTGGFRAIFRTMYEGVPLVTERPTFLYTGTGGVDLFQLQHRQTGDIQVLLYDGSGVEQINASMGAWSPVFGTEYEIAVQLNILPTNDGWVKVFIDGILFGTATQTTAIGDGSTRSTIQLGNYTVTGNNPKIMAKELEIFDGIRYEDSYTPGISLPNSIDDGGYATLARQLGAETQAFARFDSTVDLDFYGGSPTGTESAPITVSANWAIFSGQTLSWEHLNNFDVSQQGTIEFRYRPGYSTAPAADVVMTEFAPPSGSNSTILLKHTTSGSFYISFTDSVGALNTRSFGNWHPTSAQAYDIAVCFDISKTTPGDTRVQVYIDGVPKVTNPLWSVAFTRDDSQISTVGIEGNDFAIRSYMISDMYKYETAYTPVQTIDLYSREPSTVEPVSKTWVDKINGVTEVSDTDQNYVVQSDNLWYWLDSGELAETDGITYAESNLLTEWNAFAPTYNPEGTIYVSYRVFLFSDDGLTAPLVNSTTILYDGGGEPPSEVTMCHVWGYARKSDGSADQTPFQVWLTDDVAIYKDNIIIRREPLFEVTPDATGWWSIELAETAHMEGSATYTFSWGKGVTVTKQVPDAASVFYGDLV